MYAEIFDQEIIPDHSRKGKRGRPSIFVTAPSVLSEFRWRGGSLEALAKKLLDYVLSISHSARSVRVAVNEKKRMCDLEQFFSISPSRWFHLSVECHSLSGLENGAQQVLESFGYRCAEWVGVEGSESQLGAFHLETQETPSLILYVQNRGARRNCEILIPEFQ